MTHISLVYDVLCWQLLGTRVRFFVSYGRKRTVPIPQFVVPPTQIVNPAPQFVIAMKACPGLRSGMPLRRFDCASESHQSSVSSFRRRPESRGVGRGECSAGACPPLGRRGAWQNPPCQFAVPSHNSSFSYLGVPATAGMSDSYENGVTRPQVCLNATGPHFVILAEAGIQRGRVAPTTPKHLQRPSLIFIPWCAGNNRHERLL